MITKPGLMNLDFADVKAVMEDGGLALIGIGEAENDSESNRSVKAVESALNNPLVEVDVSGATGALVNIVGGKDLTLKEAEEVVELVASELAEDATIIWGAQIDEDLNDILRVTVIVTGIEDVDFHSMFNISGSGRREEEEEERPLETRKREEEKRKRETPSIDELEKIL